jgi:hypothetical protein
VVEPLRRLAAPRQELLPATLCIERATVVAPRAAAPPDQPRRTEEGGAAGDGAAAPAPATDDFGVRNFQGRRAAVIDSRYVCLIREGISVSSGAKSGKSNDIGDR